MFRGSSAQAFFCGALALASCQPVVTELPPVETVEIGPAFSTHRANTSPGSQPSINTQGNYQFFAFYSDYNKLAVGKRDLTTGAVQIHEINGNYDLIDVHYDATIGVDQDGRLHLIYDNHATTSAKYRYSLNPFDITQWSSEHTPAFLNGISYTYARFVDGPNGMRVFYRSYLGDPHRRDWEYSDLLTSPATWSQSVKVLEGTDGLAPYIHNVAHRDNKIVLGVTWRQPPPGAHNIDFTVIETDNFGASWSEPLPAHKNDLPEILNIGVDQEHSHASGGTIAPDGTVHFTASFRPTVNEGIRLHHVWRGSDNIWRVRQLESVGPFAERVYPQIVSDNERAIIVYASPADRKYYAVVLSGPDFETQKMYRLMTGPLGNSHVTIDDRRWEQDGILSALVHESLGDTWDGNPQTVETRPAYIYEWLIP